MVQVQRQFAGRIPLLFQRRSVFVLVRPSTNWMSPTHVTEGNLLYSKSTDLHVNSSRKIPSQKHLVYYLTKYLRAMA